MEQFKELISYVKEWETKDLKPCNEEVFIKEFLYLIENYPDDREITFDGEGSYFGKQITIEPFSYFGKAPRELNFEISYNENNISIYSGNHNGYWFPEYLSIHRSHPDFEEIQTKLYRFLSKVFGLCTA